MPVANMGQFNDNLQSDVFYCRDVLGVNYAVVGIIDQSTLLHQATRMPDTLSETMLDIFRKTWFKPYGFPMTIRVDPGASYAKHFRDYVERRGILLEVVPAEAHWRIGLIEMRNAVLRDILERIIDSEAVMTSDDFDAALEAAVHALNSMTYSHGRPQYMAVFGQIPRVGGGLHGAVRADILRAEAMKALAEINTSQSLRRALLRKTATPHHNQLLPGQNCAYWRWQNPRGRSTKKRGAWVVARFLSYDPDGRSAWLHSGTTTLQVSLEQLRGQAEGTSGKTLEREIPWRNIIKLPREQIDAYIESAKKEEKSWLSWGSMEEVSAETAAKILSNPPTKKRVLRSRACYRNKSKIPGRLQAKTRVVALGHLDLDLASLSRDSPTPSRTSEYILLAIFIAGKNGIMENDPVRWILWAGDVSTAFLQGAQDKSERPEDLFLLPPQDEVTKMAKTFRTPLYRVKGNIYGLC
ncbi:unnamed protein product [Cladocopium goreaui]|uniref:Copia protein n=1 Tax=Cladocopium goreaui TaxID=2562237 RepID=A0A9P1DFT2_9DINO|nr:unnamed protein product [Cladocopium goreaui]